MSTASCNDAFCHAFSANRLVESNAFRSIGTFRSVKIGQYLDAFYEQTLAQIVYLSYHALDRLTGAVIV